MKLYRTDYIDDGDSNAAHHSWTGTLADASKERKRLKLEGFRSIETTEVDVPTSKPGLIEWLNSKE